MVAVEGFDGKPAAACQAFPEAELRLGAQRFSGAGRFFHQSGQIRACHGHFHCCHALPSGSPELAYRRTFCAAI